MTGFCMCHTHWPRTSFAFFHMPLLFAHFLHQVFLIWVNFQIEIEILNLFWFNYLILVDQLIMRDHFAWLRFWASLVLIWQIIFWRLWNVSNMELLTALQRLLVVVIICRTILVAIHLTWSTWNPSFQLILVLLLYCLWVEYRWECLQWSTLGVVSLLILHFLYHLLQACWFCALTFCHFEVLQPFWSGF